MERNIEQGFFKEYFIDLIEPMYEKTEVGKFCSFYAQAYDELYVWLGILKNAKEIDKWLDDYEGSFTTYVYFYENGKVEMLVEYPYDYDKGADIVIELVGDGADEMKEIMKSEISFNAE